MSDCQDRVRWNISTRNETVSPHFEYLLNRYLEDHLAITKERVESITPPSNTPSRQALSVLP